MRCHHSEQDGAVDAHQRAESDHEAGCLEGFGRTDIGLTSDTNKYQSNNKTIQTAESTVNRGKNRDGPHLDQEGQKRTEAGHKQHKRPHTMPSHMCVSVQLDDRRCTE